LLLVSLPVYCAGTLQITKLDSDKARYAPGEIAHFDIRIDNRASEAQHYGRLIITLQDCGRAVMSKAVSVHIGPKTEETVTVALRPPTEDFRGYRVEARLIDDQGHEMAEGASALDVSSDWSRFPRYGYLSHFGDDVPVAQWIGELNRYHINGLQFYDVQYKHHLPLKPGNPTEWPDVANRTIHRNTVYAFLEAAKLRNMTSMVYNASYAAFADAFSDGSGVQLQWAAWPDPAGPRTADTVKSFPLPVGWATPRLLYMNQQSAAWQKYLFARMAELLRAFPYDGWQIDTYGDAGAWDWNGTAIDYTSGFPAFANTAHKALHKRVVLNTVSGRGAVATAASHTDFVYSELWPEDHATYASISTFADEIHAARPDRAIVFAAYLHSGLAVRPAEHGGSTVFNVPGVLLADAVIFASGAAHIELGDGGRMLSRPYFPDDSVIAVSKELQRKLVDYYDFQVAYENYLRGGVVRDPFPVRLEGVRQTEIGNAGAVWTIERKNANCSMVHLINFSGLRSNEWQDAAANYAVPPVLHDIHLHVTLPDSQTAGWISPDVDSGRWHELKLRTTFEGDWDVTVPELHYWTVVIICNHGKKPE
jgi:dextranase